MIYALFAIICFIIVGIINRKIKKAKQKEGVSADLDEILIFDTETTGIFPVQLKIKDNTKSKWHKPGQCIDRCYYQ